MLTLAGTEFIKKNTANADGKVISMTFPSPSDGMFQAEPKLETDHIQ